LETENILKSALKKFGTGYVNKQLVNIKEYLDIVYENNRKFNLIGTKERKDILVRHILDSISILRYGKEIFLDEGKNEKILDVGTGAGLPGIPLAIFLEDKTFYLLDKSMKKVNFLTELVGELKLKNVVIIRSRAEEIAKAISYRESFDVVLARAVARFDILSELTIPFSRINGKIIFYKSVRLDDELKKNREVISRLGGKVDKLLEVKVPCLNEYRAFLAIKKIKETPLIYPRSFNKIKKRPL